jgi:hypothetical protein
MNPRLYRPVLVAAAAISCLGLVDATYCQPGLGQPGAAHDAAGQRTGILPPLVDFGPEQGYHGQEGGLYPGGSNVRPAAHDAAGQKIARAIVPLAADGSPDRSKRPGCLGGRASGAIQTAGGRSERDTVTNPASSSGTCRRLLPHPLCGIAAERRTVLTSRPTRYRGLR